jgi:di/tripeptidase
MSINGLENKVIFQGFDSLYKQVLNIGDQLLCLEVQAKVQAEAEETFDDLKKSFESFQSKIRMVSLKAKCKKLQNLRQMTINDMFN